MPATYPSSVKTFVPPQDRVDIVLADYVASLQEEMSAVQTTLGTNPQGAAASVKARLAAADVLLNELAGYFMAGGVISQSQVQGLGAILTTLTDGVNGAATVTALNSAISTVTSQINTETTNRTNGDSALASAIASAVGTINTTTTSLQTQITNEVANRIADVNAEETSRIGGDNAHDSRLTTLENRFKQLEAQLQNTSARNYSSSGSYQSLYLPNSSFITSDYGGTINGHNVIELVGTQTRFYTDFHPTGSAGDIYAMTVTVTWQGTGGSSNNGVRGVRIRTAAGSTIAEFIKNANQDPNDEALSVCFIGRVATSNNYYLIPEVLQNSGGTLSMRGHAPLTPTFATFTRIPG